MERAPFKVGQRLRVIKDYYKADGATIGMGATVVACSSSGISNPIAHVKFDNGVERAVFTNVFEPMNTFDASAPRKRKLRLN
jgi:hypothetical protein